MSLFNAALEHRQDVVSQHCGCKPEQGCLGVAQGFDFTVQHRLQALEHPFDAPATAVQIGDLLSIDSVG
ncbi:hypothetical protein D3C84_998960 [compost metagenome]